MKPQWADAGHTVVKVESGFYVPADEANSDYAALLASGVEIEPYATPRPTVAEINAEAQRRIIRVTGATDMLTCLAKQMNANMRAGKLTFKVASGGELTPAEEAEAAALQAFSAKIEAIRARSDELCMSLPIDYTKDAHWPY